MTKEAEQAYTPAARQALTAFGIEASTLDFIHLSENVTFRAIDRRDGAPLVLRLHRPWYHHHDSLRSEHVWTRALVQAGIAAPEPLLTQTGESFALVDVPATGEQRWAGLARWVDGELLADVVDRETDSTVNAGHFARIGAIVASIHNQASGWSPPAEFKRHTLDADGLMGPEPFWGPFWEHPLLSAAEQDMLRTLRDQLHGALVRYGKSPASFSMIHADLHPRNILINGTRAAVIDFDDCGFGWHQYDIAVALSLYQDHPDFTLFQDACIAGYHAVRPIPDTDRALLPMFLLIRDMASLGWYHQRPELDEPGVAEQLKARVCARAATFKPLI